MASPASGNSASGALLTIGELAKLNRVRAPSYVIHVGQVLKIPTCE